MRTTVDIDAHLLKRLRAEAGRRGVSFKQALAAALRRGLDAEHTQARGKAYRAPVHAMGAPMPGVNLDKALAHAAELEDEEIVRKLTLRK